MEYHDLAEDEERGKFQDLAKILEERKASLPVVTIDGQLKLVGRADFWPIANLIDEQIKGVSA